MQFVRDETTTEKPGPTVRVFKDQTLAANVGLLYRQELEIRSPPTFPERSLTKSTTSHLTPSLLRSTIVVTLLAHQVRTTYSKLQSNVRLCYN